MIQLMPVVTVDSEELQLAFNAARNICRRHARTFYYASSFLPKPKRNAAFAVCAFLQMTTDAIDVDQHELEGGAGLRHHPVVAGQTSGCCGGIDERIQLLREKFDQIYAGKLELPSVTSRSEEQHALCAFDRTIHDHEIPRQYFLDLLEGFAMDLSIQRYATWSRLETYCYHTAGAMGLIMASIFGVTSSDAGRQAIALGNAMQLTNVLRDIKEDIGRGRIYLPLEDLARFRYSESDLTNGQMNDRFIELMKFEIDRARKLYAEGVAGLPWLADDGSRMTVAVLAAVHSGILDAIERQKYDVFNSRATLTTMQKVRRLPIAWRWMKERNLQESAHVL